MRQYFKKSEKKKNLNEMVKIRKRKLMENNLRKENMKRI